jgi:hypothetical protein
MITTQEAIKITETTTSFRINIVENPNSQARIDMISDQGEIAVKKESLEIVLEPESEVSDQQPAESS